MVFHHRKNFMGVKSTVRGETPMLTGTKN